MLVASFIDCTLLKTIQVRPRVQFGRLTCFGRECDGAMVNGIISFVMSAIVALGVRARAAFVAAFGACVGKISATRTKHDNTSNRLLQSFVDSEAMLFFKSHYL